MVNMVILFGGKHWKCILKIMLSLEIIICGYKINFAIVIELKIFPISDSSTDLLTVDLQIKTNAYFNGF